MWQRDPNLYISMVAKRVHQGCSPGEGSSWLPFIGNLPRRTSPAVVAFYNWQLCFQVCSAGLYRHVWLGRGRASVLAPVLASLNFLICQPISCTLGYHNISEARTWASLVALRLSQVASGLHCSAQALHDSAVLPPAPPSFWNCENSRPQSPIPS